MKHAAAENSPAPPPAAAREARDETRIFSGDGSKELWKFINRHGHDKDTKRSDTFWALYILGCRCQELEAVVSKLGEEVAELRSRPSAPATPEAGREGADG